MLGALLLGLVTAAPATPAAPMTVVVATKNGDVRLPVRTDPEAGPIVAAPGLLAALGGRSSVDGVWAEVVIARETFRFLIGGPVYSVAGTVKPLVGRSAFKRDTLFLPIQFVTHVLPFELKGRFRYDAATGRIEEIVGPAPVAANVARTTKAADRLPNGLRRGHVVTLDPGHGGPDPGNPGLFFPRGLKEKDVTLQMGLLVREELLKRGVGVIMTRTADTLIKLSHRGRYCTDRCDLFVSLHVNSLAARAGYRNVRGFETYFLAEALTEDEARVAQMENDAIRFEAQGEDDVGGGLGFILKDLQVNEHQRESARLAELVQSHVSEVHTGPNKGVKQAPYTVLATARRPAVLVEMGFSTNKEDAMMMTAPRQQRNLASSIADAIVSYLLEYERRVGTAVAADQQSGAP
jgi:N-acetylmuramoyl-L-alanine amidase